MKNNKKEIKKNKLTLKEEKPKLVEKTVTPILPEEKIEIVSPINEPFITDDLKMVEKLQSIFPVKSITKNNDKRTFVFYATKGQIEDYLRG